MMQFSDDAIYLVYNETIAPHLISLDSPSPRGRMGGFPSRSVAGSRVDELCSDDHVSSEHVDLSHFFLGCRIGTLDDGFGGELTSRRKG